MFGAYFLVYESRFQSDIGPGTFDLKPCSLSCYHVKGSGQSMVEAAPETHEQSRTLPQQNQTSTGFHCDGTSHCNHLPGDLGSGPFARRLEEAKAAWRPRKLREQYKTDLFRV